MTFCGADVAKALGYSNSRDAIIRHCKTDGVVFHDIIDGMGRTQQAKFITKGNLCRLAANSELPSAERFESWIFDEVIPAVLEHGSYVVDKGIRQQPLNPLDCFEQMLKVARQQDERLKALETSNQQISDSVETIQQAVVFHPDDWRNNVNRMLNHIAKNAGNANAYQHIRAALYEELERRAHCDLNRRLDNYRTRMAKEGCAKTSVKAANRLDVIEQDPRLREIFLSIVKAAVVRSGVSAKRH
ncbi:Bro-N domain-containing protein [Ethanoligenens sp.]|uniref:BRO-N domain-containing protein n=1 Tax=Ethanoligenens sp. TaxID=2099655 RepID=UPI0039E7E04D